MTRSPPPIDAPSEGEPVRSPRDSDTDPTRAPLSSSGDRDLSTILRQTMARPPDVVDVLPGVQQKLRERSGGKFYRDRWSTDRYPPIPTYLVTSAVMLVVAAMAYVILRPLSGVATTAPTPAPVRIVPPTPTR